MPTAQNTDRTEQRIALIDLFDAMWNTQNISGVLDCFTEDAVVSIVCPQHRSSVVYRGQQQIRDFVEQTIGGCVIRGRSHHVVGDRVIWMVTVANDDLRQMGVGAVRNRNEAVIREGKIVAHTVTMTPEAGCDTRCRNRPECGVSGTPGSLIAESARIIKSTDWSYCSTAHGSGNGFRSWEYCSFKQHLIEAAN